MERICKSSKYAEKFIITDKASCIPTGNSNRTESQTYLNFSIVVRFFYFKLSFWNTIFNHFPAFFQYALF